MSKEQCELRDDELDLITGGSERISPNISRPGARDLNSPLDWGGNLTLEHGDAIDFQHPLEGTITRLPPEHTIPVPGGGIDTTSPTIEIPQVDMLDNPTGLTERIPNPNYIPQSDTVIAPDDRQIPGQDSPTPPNGDRGNNEVPAQDPLNGDGDNHGVPGQDSPDPPNGDRCNHGDADHDGGSVDYAGSSVDYGGSTDFGGSSFA